MKIEIIFTFFILFNSCNYALLSPSTDECTYVSSNMFQTLKPLPQTKMPVTRWTVNGQYPAPIIQANFGDRLLINVTNKFGDPATVHWHGLFQNGTNFYDGPVGVTQCPIPNGVSFLYNFTLNQYGTYWYHSHITGQIIDGLKGPL
ncbi:1120_t:CDS:2, partial [Dentiscutata erythropus]